MPKGPTDSINKAKATFEELKKESLIKGKNLATPSQIAKRSGTSRDNLYAQKTVDWKEFANEVKEFAKEFKTLARGKYKNPEVEVYKQEVKKWKEKYVAMTEQNYELLKQVNDLNIIIKEKQLTINQLKNLKIKEEES